MCNKAFSRNTAIRCSFIPLVDEPSPHFLHAQSFIQGSFKIASFHDEREGLLKDPFESSLKLHTA